MIGSVYNHTIIENFEYFWINNFSFRRREIPGWYKLVHWQIPLLNQTLVYIKQTGLVFAHFSQQFMLLPLNFSTSTFRVTIAVWQLTILLVLKPFSTWSFLIQNSFSSSHHWLLLQDCFFSSVHVLEELHSGVPLWPAMGLLVGLSFFRISWNFRLAEGSGSLSYDWVPVNHKVFFWTFLRSLLIPPQWDEGRFPQQTWPDPCIHSLHQTTGIFSSLIVNLVTLVCMSWQFDVI